MAKNSTKKSVNSDGENSDGERERKAVEKLRAECSLNALYAPTMVVYIAMRRGLPIPKILRLCG
jgi:hypothetical protein